MFESVFRLVQVEFVAGQDGPAVFHVTGLSEEQCRAAQSGGHCGQWLQKLTEDGRFILKFKAKVLLVFVQHY